MVKLFSDEENDYMCKDSRTIPLELREMLLSIDGENKQLPLGYVTPNNINHYSLSLSKTYNVKASAYVKEGFHYKNEDGEEEQLPRAHLGLENYKMTREQSERQQALLTKCIEAYPGIDKHTITIMVDYFAMHPDKLDADNRKEDDYLAYIGEED
jgi:hypothetical protein